MLCECEVLYVMQHRRPWGVLPVLLGVPNQSVKRRFEKMVNVQQSP